DQPGGDLARLPGVSAEERTITAHVDDSWYAGREPVQLTQCAGREDLPGGSRNSQSMAHIPLSFLARQRLQVIASRDALSQLAQLVAIQQVAQFRLADQDDLQKLLRRSFEIGQQPNLFQSFGRQILRLIDDDEEP